MNDELPNRIVVIHHSADFDGLFCREIARTFLPRGTELIGWDFGDAALPFPEKDVRYVVMDLPVTAPFGMKFEDGWLAWDNFVMTKEQRQVQPLDRVDWSHWTWIDHHKSAIESHPIDIPGYRIDGVAACRLAWQWFTQLEYLAWNWKPLELPLKRDFVDRTVKEPLAVRLAGEYDIWDKRDARAERFQHGLKSMELGREDWDVLLSRNAGLMVNTLLEGGRVLQYARGQEYKEVIQSQGFDLDFEGLKFLACNSHELDIRSQLFEAGIKPHHEGLLGFTFTGKEWRVSMYGVPRFPDTDLSQIAVKYGGGGHAQACGFRISVLPFDLPR